jgi:uncharacterized membrane protein required for colicin V production
MTIWLLTLLLLACLAAAGYRQGAIRASISFLGIILAALLAVPLGKLVGPLLKILGVTNPILLWLLPPFVAFVVVLALVKIGAFMVHQKVDVFYKYKAGDLRLSLWERLNARLGACVGLLNGTVYLVLISFLIHAFSYWTVQMEAGENDPRVQRLLSQLGRDLQSTGMARVAKSVDSLPVAYYDSADLAGLLFQNSLLEARLLRYPGFLSLGERTEFQTLGQDSAFAEMRLKQTPLREVMEYPAVKAVFDNPDLLRTIWATVQPDMKDLQGYLQTGKSAKYDEERLLGRWNFDANGTVLVYRRAKPNVAGGEVAKLRAWMAEKFPKSSIVAAPDHAVILKNLPLIVMQPGQPLVGDSKNLKGEWKSVGTGYEFDLEGSTAKRTAKFEGSRLVISGEGTPVVFEKEN